MPNNNKSQLPSRDLILNYVERSITHTRQDIKSWKVALKMAQNAEYPRNYKLQLLYDDILMDALLFSQVQNRREQALAMPFSLVNAAGEAQEEATQKLRVRSSARKIINHLLGSLYYGYSLIELEPVQLKNGEYDFEVHLIPRTNVIPQRGLFIKDYTDDRQGILYRELKEFGISILEFDQKDIGLLNRAVPSVLFKKFAASCWSELCEIYGIPPRTLKTNTADPRQLSKAKRMMEDMGAAAWFIIDRTEELQFAQGVETSGDVYNNLIRYCNNELSMLISGAIVGQDTQFGSNAKESTSQDMLWQLIQSDMRMVEDSFNNIVLPAYADAGILPADLYFRYAASEDVDQLFKFTQGLLPYKEIDDEWIKEKFGVAVTGNRQISNPFGDQLSAAGDFFV